jgi:hypothetical protein
MKNNPACFHHIYCATDNIVITQPKFALHTQYRWSGLRAAISALTLFILAPAALAATAAQQNFASPAAAVTALVEAVKANDQKRLLGILGSNGSKLISSGDAVADARSRETFIKAYDEANKLVPEGDRHATLVIGKDEWPLPIPLVKSGNAGWHFDTRRGEKEILSRRIGRNELAAIQVCLAIVDAQREYAARDPDGDGIRHYASRLVSTPAKRDGLYWPTKEGEQPSPLGPLLAAAAKDGYAGTNSGSLAPYHGYIYRIVARQGRNAPGGAYDFRVSGRMKGGFGVIAYPARYGASGVMTFVVSHDGVVHEINLGRNTAALASAMTTFDPDASWKRP